MVSLRDVLYNSAGCLVEKNNHPPQKVGTSEVEIVVDSILGDIPPKKGHRHIFRVKVRKLSLFQQRNHWL